MSGERTTDECAAKKRMRDGPINEVALFGRALSNDAQSRR